MHVMQSVAQGDWTMWTSVYNLDTGQYEVAHRRDVENRHRDRLSVSPQ